MSYTKEVWTDSKPLNMADLLHMETQVTESLADLTTHDETGHPSLYYTKTLMDEYFWSENNDGLDSGLNADMLNGEHASDIISGIVSGFMGWWDARNGVIPSGFLFCDGTLGTLDMRGRFPVGAGTLGVGATGGNSVITPEGSIVIGGCTLTPQQILHSHGYIDNNTSSVQHFSPGGDGTYQNKSSDSTATGQITSTVGGNTPHTHPGTFAGDPVSMYPMYNTLIVIQKS